MKKFFLSTLLVLTAMTVSAQSTAALVRALGGASKATANGNTVTLTADVTLGRTALVVPAGVTLDLTKDGVRLMLGSNATLTVNGTVNAKAEGINIDSAAANPATINGSGTINLSGKGTLLNINNGRKLILDGVTLVGIAENDDEFVEVGKGGELVMKSGTITGNAWAGDSGNGGGVVVNGGTFTMEGGAITGNNAGIGGGVFISEGGTFTMSGGEISGNSADRYGGGGVRVTGQGTTFTMTDGIISRNSAPKSSGGGVSADRGSIFTMTGGEISSNSASGGGGISLALSTIFTMEGGIISGNSAHFGGEANGGGGILVGDQATFTMKGGRIQGSTASDGFAANTDTRFNQSAALRVYGTATAARWGTGGTYTMGGVSQTGGSNFVPRDSGTNDTLIAIPAR